MSLRNIKKFNIPLLFTNKLTTGKTNCLRAKSDKCLPTGILQDLPREDAIPKCEDTIIVKDDLNEIRISTEIVEQALTEKEKDACVRSRLSKECRELLKVSGNSRLTLDVSNINVVKNQNDKKCSTWDDYNFDHLLLKTPISGEPGGARPPTTKPPGSTGSTVSANRIVRQEPGQVIFECIPVEWWKAFLPKTGVTGFGTFLVTFSTYLISKEYYVLEHNFYGGLSMMLMCIGAVKYIGPPLAQYLDKQIDVYEATWLKVSADAKKEYEDEIAYEKFIQYQADGQLPLIDAKRENVMFQLEEEFRIRQMHVYEEVIRILDYQVGVAQAHRKIQQKNLVAYVHREVLKSITPDMQDKLINYSLENIIAELEKHNKEPPKGGSGGTPQGSGGSPQGSGGSPQGGGAAPAASAAAKPDTSGKLPPAPGQTSSSAGKDACKTPKQDCPKEDPCKETQPKSKDSCDDPCAVEQDPCNSPSGEDPCK